MQNIDITKFSQEDALQFKELSKEKDEILSKMLKLDINTLERLNKIDNQLTALGEKYGSSK